MEFIRQKVVKTRKEHHCFGCAREFPTGSELQVITSVDGGDIFTNYWCKTCRNYWDKYMDNQDLIGCGELKSEDEEGWEEMREDTEGRMEINERFSM